MSRTEANATRRIRWWPVAVILLLALGAVVWIWMFYGRHRQDKNLATAQVVIYAFLLLLLWCLAFSRLRWQVRVGVLGGVVGLVALVPALVRIHGVTGDLIPILEWRWKHKSAPLLIAPTGAALSKAKAQPGQGIADYPQFLGPHRNATVDGTRLARDWKAQPPQALWRQPVGLGWSGFAVAGNRAITQEQRGEEEVVVCYDLLSGMVLWTCAYTARYQSTLAGEGPRATPTIAGKRVYAQGATGILNCLDLETGKAIWSKDIVQDNHSHVSEWGMSCSPLVMGAASGSAEVQTVSAGNGKHDEELVVVSAGGSEDRSLVAYRAADGKFVWGGGNDSAAYSSPYHTILAGVPQILIFNSYGVCAHQAADGKVLWKYRWPGGHPHVCTPAILPGDRVLVSSGYGVGSELVSIQKDSAGQFTANRIWKSNRLKAKFTNVVYRDGFIYGLDDGIMVCLAATDGELKWKEGRYGHGQEILVGHLLLVMAESGEVILLEPNPQESREVARFRALAGKTWNPPALAGEHLVVRNDKEAACYRLPVARN